MKKHIFAPAHLLLTGAVFALAFAGCDKIDAPYETVNVSSIDTVAYPPPAFVLNYSEPRRVLVEDYTGHTCGNCPTAAVILENMIDASGGKIIGIAVHAGETFAAPSMPNYPEDFRTTVGTAWDGVFGITSAGQPNGMINRKKNNGVYYAIPGTWNTKVSGILSASPVADAHVQVKAYHNASRNKIIAYVNAGFLQSLSGAYSLAAYVVEDSVIGDQKWYNQGLPQDHYEDYVFMHMLRGNVSPIWGEIIATDPAVGSVYRKAWSLTVQPEWNVEQLKIIAVLFNKDTYEVIQPAEIHVEH